ncbi:hypothetical protein DFJ74DRAFT_706729 [Hyaloraphidium curvatum]|nr:hypothetical protein DFJ74DRAFT_706729 [Hyaloraphidium curvatum]
MARPVRFWHSTDLKSPWVMTAGRDGADEGEDELFSDDETAPHLVTSSPGWRKMTEAQETEAFREFKHRFAFANAGGKDAPAVRPPGPFLVLSAAAMLLPLDGFSEQARVDLCVDWHRRLAQALKAVCGAAKKPLAVYCTDPYHEGYIIDAKKMSYESWERSAVPDGDYTLFTTSDYKNGVFVHPWQRSICVFGAEMLAELGLLAQFRGDVVGELPKNLEGQGAPPKMWAGKEGKVLKGATF